MYVTLLPIHKQECAVLTVSSTAPHIDAPAATRMGISIQLDQIRHERYMQQLTVVQGE